MSTIEEYFTPTMLAEVKTTAQIEVPPYVRDGGWEVNRPRERTAFQVRQAQQKLEVYDAREKLAQIAEMINGLKSIEGQVEEIQQFVKDNGLTGMVSFCAWDDPMSTLDQILRADPEGDALQWMHSDHSC